MKILTLFIVFALAPVVHATEFKHVGDFLLHAQYKLTGQQMTPIPTKRIAFSVFSDGATSGSPQKGMRMPGPLLKSIGPTGSAASGKAPARSKSFRASKRRAMSVACCATCGSLASP